MSVVIIEHGKLGARLRSDAAGGANAVTKAMFSAAQRGKAYIVSNTPVDRGILKNAWKVVRLSDGAELVNDQPYAGIVELGARPFKMSSAGIFALKAWVMRKLQSGEMNGRSSIKGWNGLIAKYTGKSKVMRRSKTFKLEREAENIAYAIAKSFEKLGMKGKRFVLMNLPKLAELMDDEINRYLGNFFNRQPGKNT